VNLSRFANGNGPVACVDGRGRRGGKNVIGGFWYRIRTTAGSSSVLKKVQGFALWGQFGSGFHINQSIAGGEERNLTIRIVNYGYRPGLGELKVGK